MYSGWPEPAVGAAESAAARALRRREEHPSKPAAAGAIPRNSPRSLQAGQVGRRRSRRSRVGPLESHGRQSASTQPRSRRALGKPDTRARAHANKTAVPRTSTRGQTGLAPPHGLRRHFYSRRMEQLRLPWEETERIPRDLIPQLFRRPPEVIGDPASVGLRGLVIGAQGAGKSMLLQQLEGTHRGIAILMDLRHQLSSLTSESGQGAANFKLSVSQSSQLHGKSASLLALAIATRANQLTDGPKIEVPLLAACLPRDHRPRRSLTPKGLADLRADIERAPLPQFQALGKTGALRELAESLGTQLTAQDRPLTLLFDKGDMVAAPALGAVFELLDQARNYSALLSMRPGVPVQAMPFLAWTGTPGDHYPVITLGSRPRSPEWAGFAAAVLSAPRDDVQKYFLSLKPRSIEAVIALSHGSLRVAVKVLWLARHLSGPEDHRLRQAAGTVRAELLNVIRARLHEFTSDVGRLIKDLREGGTVPGRPVQLVIDESNQGELLPVASDLDRFLALALRHDLFGTPEESPWRPGAVPRVLELNPLLVWDPSADDLPSLQANAPVRTVRKPSELWSSGGRAKPRTYEVFVALETDDPRSALLPSRLQQGFDELPGTTRLVVTQGHENRRERWAPEIRRKIETARAVVADVTHLRNDVICEMGYGHGLGRPVIPVSFTELDRKRCPRWLRAWWQDRVDQPDLGVVVERIGELAAKRTSPGRVVPNLILWLGHQDWAASSREQAEALAMTGGIRFEQALVEDSDREDSQSAIDRARVAGMLIVSIGGELSDKLMHFTAAGVIARPKPHQGVPRRVVVVVRDSASVGDSSLVAESLRRSEYVSVVEPRDVRAAVGEYVEAVRAWRNNHG